MICGPRDGQVLTVSKVEEQYFMPCLDVVEEPKVDGQLNCYQSTTYNTVTVPRSFTDGSPWFMAIAEGHTVDDAFDLLILRYRNE